MISTYPFAHTETVADVGQPHWAAAVQAPLKVGLHVAAGVELVVIVVVVSAAV